MKTRLMIISALIAIATGLTGCVDELLNPDNEFGDGEAVISAEAVFQNFTSTGLGTRTPGNTLGNIDKLDVFIFKPNGELIEHYPIPKGNWTSTEENTGRPDDKETTEDPTMRVKFTLPAPLHYGRYKMYAVANVEADKLQGVETIDDLLGIQLTWNPDDIPANNQMLGFFSSDDRNESVNYDSFAAPTIAVKAPNTTLYAWVRRAASKVTVAYDGRDLLDNVYIYLKSVTVHNVNKTAYLGKESKANSSADVYGSGETEYYYDRAQYPAGPPQSAFGPGWKTTVTKGGFLHGSDHSDKSNALFFFENMQGDGESKLQDADHDGEIDSPGSNDPNDPDWRDKKPNGTYIEVDAWYVSNIPGHMGNGPIKYRFMLGQDEKTNYDAMRNCHYKVTLHFNKYANDVDWHIDYDKPTPSIDAPNPCYISYLYDKDMEMPVQINGELHKDSLVTARILTNDWYPYDAPSNMYYTPEAKNNTPWNGFLSLKNTEGRVNVGKPGDGYAYNINKKFYEDNERGIRQYNTTISDAPQGTPSEGQYRVIKNEDGRIGITIIMPLYTRAKNLYADTGYTGNNPYPAYQRKATVEIKAILYDPNKHDYRPFYDTITVYQVRRIVNPKGVWRDWNETGKFYVQLTHLLQSVGTDIQNSADQFVTFVSQGPWSAEVVGSNTGWVRLTKGAKSREVGGKIYGDTGSEIEFYYEPTDKLSSADAEPRCAMIRIRYHNFSCEHTIFVRQGYAPLAVASGQKRWYSYNMRTQTERTQSPLEEGSMFKWRSWNIPINATNNKRGGVYGFNQNLWSSPLWIYPTNQDDKGAKAKWREIGRDAAQGGTWDNATIDGKSVQIATVDDYLALRNNENVFYGYGVLYGGTSDRVQMAVKDAYGYYYDDPETKTGKGTNGKGMRGVFVYNKTTGDQIFFPISASGYGRRRGKTIEGENTSVGKLRYANRFELYNSPADQIKCRPLFYRLYLSPGAIYWVNEKGDVDGTATYSWDMNYDSFNFNGFTTNSYDGGAVGVADGQSTGGSDACYVRCVTDTKTASPVRKKTKAAKRKNPAKLQRKFRK